jgi:translation initiation factor 5
MHATIFIGDRSLTRFLLGHSNSSFSNPNSHYSRISTDVLKYFGLELGAQTKFDKKAGTCIVNGAHDASKLSEILETFIKKFVQCYSCGNPETMVKIKRENILLKCKACGFVSEVDARLRLCSFIVKNPPENKLSKAEKKVKKAEKERMKDLIDTADVPGSGEKKDKKDKKKSKDKKDKKKKRKGEDDEEDSGDEDGDDNDDDVEDDDDDDEDDVVWMTDTSEEAMKKRAAEQLSQATAALVTQGNVEAEREAAKKREEKRLAEEAAAAKARAEEEARLAAEAAALKISDPASALRQLLEKGAKPGEVESEIKAVEGGPAVRMKVLYTALFGTVPESTRVSSVLEEKEAYLTPHAGDPAGQLAQLVAMEHLLGVTLEGRSREAPLVLKALYDADLAEEDLIVAWFNKTDAGAVLGVPEDAAKAVRSASKPFVDWLQEDSDDESEEEDESSDEEE